MSILRSSHVTLSNLSTKDHGKAMVVGGWLWVGSPVTVGNKSDSPGSETRPLYTLQSFVLSQQGRGTSSRVISVALVGGLLSLMSVCFLVESNLLLALACFVAISPNLKMSFWDPKI